MIELTTRPRGRGRFAVYIADRWLCDSRQPLLDGARYLRDHGYNPYELVTIRAAGCPYASFKPAPIYVLAGLRIEESDARALKVRAWESLDPTRVGRGVDQASDLDAEAAE